MLRAGEYATPFHNNCSGKHAAMLAFAKHIDADLNTYELAENPVQAKILDAIAALTEIPMAKIQTGIDGCCVTNFAVPVSAMAKSFMNLVRPVSFDDKTQAACKRIVSAMLNHPELIGGSERLDTMLMQAAPGQFISKVGADGVWLCGVLPSEKFPTGLAIALKVEDGDDKRGRPVIAVEILRQLGLFSPETLKEVSPMPLKNRRGDLVGKVESSLQINS
jgi:L-asparaginase II